jgi:hypothetical protein
MTEFGDHAHEVLPGLWVGDQWACEIARERGMRRLCVLEGSCAVPACRHYRILSPDGSAEILRLDSSMREISDIWPQKRLLVHCGAGVERSPLTLAWFLMRRLYVSLDDGYAWLKKCRPVVEDRQSWIRR